MAKVFLSHSSKDKLVVRRIAEALTELEHTVWLDEWEIRVGDCIPTKVSEGIDGSDCVVVALSKASVESGWVDREWKAKVWDEIGTRRLRVLPVLLEQCDVPVLLRTKKYANFAKSFSLGLVELSNAISLAFPNTHQPAPSDFSVPFAILDESRAVAAQPVLEAGCPIAVYVLNNRVDEGKTDGPQIQFMGIPQPSGDRLAIQIENVSGKTIQEPITHIYLILEQRSVVTPFYIKDGRYGTPTIYEDPPLLNRFVCKFRIWLDEPIHLPARAVERFTIPLVADHLQDFPRLHYLPALLEVLVSDNAYRFRFDIVFIGGQ